MVFGKVVSGIDLLKKLEAVGGEIGIPTRQVKIVEIQVHTTFSILYFP